MELNELHILEREPRTVRHCQPIARHSFGIRGEAEDLSRSAGGDNQRLAAN